MLKKRGLAALVFVIVGLTYVGYRIIPHLDWEYLTHEESPGMWTLLQAEFGDIHALERIGDFYIKGYVHAAYGGDGNWCGRLDTYDGWLMKYMQYPAYQDYAAELLKSNQAERKDFIELERKQYERNQNYQSRCWQRGK